MWQYRLELKVEQGLNFVKNSRVFIHATELFSAWTVGKHWNPICVVTGTGKSRVDLVIIVIIRRERKPASSMIPGDHN